MGHLYFGQLWGAAFRRHLYYLLGKAWLLLKKKYRMSEGDEVESVMGYRSAVERRAAVIRSMSFFLSWHFRS